MGADIDAVVAPRQVILGLLGAKQSGKDTVYRCIARHTLATRLAFADGVKEEIADALGLPVSYIEENKTQLRGLLQHWGTELRRGLFDNDYWVKYLTRKLERVRTPVVVITDCRFPNEGRMILERGGMLARVIRGEIAPADGHASEQWWCSPEAERMAPEIIPNTGTIEQLDAVVRQFLSDNFPQLETP